MDIHINSNLNNQHKRKALYNVSLVLLIDSIGYGVIFPILPQLFFDADLGFMLPAHLSIALLYSITLMAYPCSQFFGMAFFGVLSDRYGKGIMLLCGVSSIVAGYLLSTIAVFMHSFYLFLISRAISGFTGGVYSVCNALICDISGSDPKARFNNLRLPTVAAKLGTVIGPALAIFVSIDFLGKNVLATPFCIAVGLATANFFYLYISLKKFPPELIRKAQVAATKFKPSQLFDGIFEFFYDKSTRLLAIAFLSYQLISTLVAQSFTLYLTANFNYHTKQLGLFSVVMSGIVIASTFSCKPLVKHFSQIALLRITLLILIALFAYSYVATKLDIHLFYQIIIRTWVLATLFYLALPLTQLLFKTLCLNDSTENNDGQINSALGQIATLSTIASATIVGHAVLHHWILPMAIITFSISLICLYKLKV